MAVLILALLAAALEMYALGHRWGYYLPLDYQQHLEYDISYMLDGKGYMQNGEEVGASPSLLLCSFLFSHLPLTIIGIAQTVRRTAPTAFVAASITALASIGRCFYKGVFEVDLPAVSAYVILLILTGFTLWGRLPHRTHTPRSAITANALGIASLWAIIAAFSLQVTTGWSTGIIRYHLGLELTLVTAVLTLACGTSLLVLMSRRKSVIIMRLLVIPVGAGTLAAILPPIDSHFYFQPYSIPAIMVVLALVIPVFFPSFKQWCDGTWPMSTRNAAAGRPTILARTYQTIGADGTPLDDASVAALLPSVRPTFWISFFFGLFGLIPMITANSTARGLGVVTHAYNHAMIKGLLLGIVTWFGLVFTLYAVVLFSALSSHY